MKKIIISVLMFILAFSPVFATPVQAQWIDISQAAKEYGLDSIGWILVNKIIERMSASTVNWINSGFKGSPAFVTNPEKYFTNMGDQLAGQFIFSGNTNLNFLCGPLKAKIKLTLAKNYAQDQNRFACTLTDAMKNTEGFMNNFENGGWEGFFQLTQEPQNNPLGAYLMAEGELFNKIAQQTGQTNQELDRSGGFLSYKKCRPGTEYKPESGALTGNNIINRTPTTPKCKVMESAKDIPVSPVTGAPLRAPQCKEYEAVQETEISSGVVIGDCAPEDKYTVTPGSVISDKLNEALGAGQEKLQVADELNEIISALLNQLVSKAMTGLFSLSRPDSTESGSKSFASQLIDSSSTSTPLVDYFGNKAEPVLNPMPKVEVPVIYIQARDCDYIVRSGQLDSIGPSTMVRCQDTCLENPQECVRENKTETNTAP